MDLYNLLRNPEKDYAEKTEVSESERRSYLKQAIDKVCYILSYLDLKRCWDNGSDLRLQERCTSDSNFHLK